MISVKIFTFLFKTAVIIAVILILGLLVWYFFPNFLNINRYLPAEQSSLSKITPERRQGLEVGDSLEGLTRSEIETEFRNQNTELKKKEFLENLSGEKVIWVATFRNSKPYNKDGYDYEIITRDGLLTTYFYTNNQSHTSFNPEDKVLIEARIISVTELFFTFTVKAKVIDIQKL